MKSSRLFMCECGNNGRAGASRKCGRGSFRDTKKARSERCQTWSAPMKITWPRMNAESTTIETMNLGCLTRVHSRVHSWPNCFFYKQGPRAKKRFALGEIGFVIASPQI